MEEENDAYCKKQIHGTRWDYGDQYYNTWGYRKTDKAAQAVRRFGSTNTFEQRIEAEKEYTIDRIPEEYRNGKSQELYERGIQIGKDGSIIQEGDQVYDLEERSTTTVNRFRGMHPLKWKRGGITWAPFEEKDREDGRGRYAYQMIRTKGHTERQIQKSAKDMEKEERRTTGEQ